MFRKIMSFLFEGVSPLPDTARWGGKFRVVAKTRQDGKTTFHPQEYSGYGFYLMSGKSGIIFYDTFKEAEKFLDCHYRLEIRETKVVS